MHNQFQHCNVSDNFDNVFLFVAVIILSPFVIDERHRIEILSVCIFLKKSTTLIEMSFFLRYYILGGGIELKNIKLLSKMSRTSKSNCNLSFHFLKNKDNFRNLSLPCLF